MDGRFSIPITKSETGPYVQYTYARSCSILRNAGEEVVAKAKEDAASIIDRAHVEAELEKQKITDDVKKEMISVASVLAEKAVGESMDHAIQDRLVDETLKEIGDGTWLS